VHRYLVLFARDPGSEARAKGFGASGEDLFATFADGWRDAARQVRARVIVAAPPQDLAAWRCRVGPDETCVSFLPQRGSSFGERLEHVVRQASRLPGPAVVVGGDVAPVVSVLREAFEALEGGADAVIAPAGDGGVSLLALPNGDADLVSGWEPRQRQVARRLTLELSSRGRRVVLLAAACDVDSRRGLRGLLRDRLLTAILRTLVLRILRMRTLGRRDVPAARCRALSYPSGLRAPPAA
jgi:glycosyltransferase A (GT-A) superfamily protein (DUF2064 family)